MSAKFRWERAERLWGFEHDETKYATNGHVIATLAYCNPATEAIALRGFAAYPAWKRNKEHRPEFIDQSDVAEKVAPYLSLADTVPGEFLSTVCDMMQPDDSGPLHLFAGGDKAQPVCFAYADKSMAPFLPELAQGKLTIYLPLDTKRPAVIVDRKAKIVAVVMPMRIEWEAFVPMAKAVMDEVQRAKETEAAREAAHLAALAQANAEIDQLTRINQEEAT